MFDTKISLTSPLSKPVDSSHLLLTHRLPQLLKVECDLQIIVILALLGDAQAKVERHVEDLLDLVHLLVV